MMYGAALPHVKAVSTARLWAGHGRTQCVGWHGMAWHDALWSTSAHHSIAQHCAVLWGCRSLNRCSTLHSMHITAWQHLAPFLAP
jgi:hypothetical protein